MHSPRTYSPRESQQRPRAGLPLAAVGGNRRRRCHPPSGGGDGDDTCHHDGDDVTRHRRHRPVSCADSPNRVTAPSPAASPVFGEQAWQGDTRRQCRRRRRPTAPTRHSTGGGSLTTVRAKEAHVSNGPLSVDLAWASRRSAAPTGSEMPRKQPALQQHREASPPASRNDAGRPWL